MLPPQQWSRGDTGQFRSCCSRYKKNIILYSRYLTLPCYLCSSLLFILRQKDFAKERLHKSTKSSVNTIDKTGLSVHKLSSSERLSEKAWRSNQDTLQRFRSLLFWVANDRNRPDQDVYTAKNTPRDCWAAVPSKYFYRWLQHLQGNYKVVFEFKDGTKLIEYESISFGRMSQKTFQDGW